jgi:hypothetical protein
MVKGAVVRTTVTAMAAVVAHRSDCGVRADEFGLYHSLIGMNALGLLGCGCDYGFKYVTATAMTTCMRSWLARGRMIVTVGATMLATMMSTSNGTTNSIDCCGENCEDDEARPEIIYAHTSQSQW